jgi:hypothetical protein
VVVAVRWWHVGRGLGRPASRLWIILILSTNSVRADRTLAHPVCVRVGYVIEWCVCVCVERGRDVCVCGTLTLTHNVTACWV